MAATHNTQAQKDRIKKNLATLDYMEGEGFIRRPKRPISGDQHYIVVGLGGTGCNALAETKKKLQKKVDAASLRQYVRFLAIDTCHNELKQYVESKGIFSYSEIVPLPYDGVARDIRNPPDNMKEWLNPDLWRHSANSFRGDGASARRMCGRVLLSSPNAVLTLQDKVVEAFSSLVTGTANAKCNIIVLTGIAGGTGSGSVIDATYMLRQIVQDQGESSKGRTFGFVFLPPATSKQLESKPNAERNGNRNGYAALKEIEHHMGMHDRDEAFLMKYGSTLDVDQQNLFDYCCIVDGRGSNIIHGNPQLVAANAAADCILNIITPETTDSNAAGGGLGITHNSIISMLSDVTAKMDTFVASQPPQSIPRDTFYKYATTGYSEMVIPRDLLAVYAAHKVFAKLFTWYKECEYADAAAAKKKLTDCWLWDPLALKKRIHDKAGLSVTSGKNEIDVRVDEAAAEIEMLLEENFQKEIDYAFKQRGPYFMVNLTLAMANAMQKIDVPNYTGLLEKYRNNAEFDAVRRIWHEYTQKLFAMNSATYEVFTQVIDTMKVMLEETASIVTRTNEVTSGSSKNFTWTPLQIGDNYRAAGLSFIDDLLDEQRVNQITEQFKAHLLGMRKAWEAGAADGTFDPAEAVRSFISNEFQNVLTINLQDFIAKVFTGDQDAFAVVEDEQGNKTPTPALEQAASAIARLLKDKAQKLAELDGYAAFVGANDANFLILPAETEELNALLQQHMSGYTTFIAKNSDSFSLFENSLSLPLYAFVWTLKGEKAYAECVSGGGEDAVGQHMDEKTRNWVRLPNLINRDKWPINWSFPMEIAIADHVAALADKAAEYGLITQTGTKYSVHVFNDEPGTVLGETRQPLGETNANDSLVKQAQAVYAAEASRLFNLVSPNGDYVDLSQSKNLFSDELTMQDTKPTCCQMNPGTTTPEDGWDWKLTQKFLRKMYDVTLSLQRTIGVMEAIDALNPPKPNPLNPKHFRNYYGHGFIGFDAEEQYWFYLDEDGNGQELLNILDIEPWQIPYQVYFAYEKFIALPAELFEHWSEQYEETKKDKQKEAARRQNELCAQLEATETETKKPAFQRKVKEREGNDSLVNPIRKFYQMIVGTFAG